MKSTHYVVHVKVERVVKTWASNKSGYGKDASVTPVREVEALMVSTVSRATLKACGELLKMQLESIEGEEDIPADVARYDQS